MQRDERPLAARASSFARSLPRAGLPLRETPVERWHAGGASLLIKRDDLSCAPLGGNKVRALDLLLAGVRRDDTVLTVGPTGSTHALAVATYAASLGARTEVLAWPQEMHDVAHATAARLSQLARVTRVRSPMEAYMRAAARRVRGDVRWVPAGGSNALGALGHADAALELVAQLAREGRAMPGTIVAPLGSGGTVAGLLLGLSIAGATTSLCAVRVVPRILGNRGHVLTLARRARRLLLRSTGEKVARVNGSLLELRGDAYGGAYGRETDAAREAMVALRDAGGPRLEGTYSAKAFAVALDRARGTSDGDVLFWLTFDARWISASAAAPPHTT